MDFEAAKILFGVGLILTLLGLGVVGFIFILIGLYSLAKHYGRRGIFTNALYAAVLSVVGFVAALAVFFTTTAAAYLLPLVTSPGDIYLLLVPWAVFSAFQAASAYFMKRSFEAIGEASGEEIFKTAATLTLVGGLTVIVLIGLVILFIAFLLATIGAFALTPQAKKTPQPGAYAQPPSI